MSVVLHLICVAREQPRLKSLVPVRVSHRTLASINTVYIEGQTAYELNLGPAKGHFLMHWPSENVQKQTKAACFGD